MNDGLTGSLPLRVPHRLLDLLSVLLEQIPDFLEGHVTVLIGIHQVDELHEAVLGNFELPDSFDAHLLTLHSLRICDECACRVASVDGHCRSPSEVVSGEPLLRASL